MAGLSVTTKNKTLLPEQRSSAQLATDESATGEVATGERVRRRSNAARFSRRQRWWGNKLLGVVELAVLIGIWQLIGATTGLVDVQQISSPVAVAKRFWAGFVTQRFIYGDLAVSAEEIAIGLGLGIVVGVIVGVAMGRVKIVFRLLDPIVTFLYGTPAVAFISLLIIWLGIGTAPKVALIFSGVVFVVIVNTETGVRTIDHNIVEMARSFRASRFQVLRKVVLPGAVPVMLAGFRLAVGRSLIMMLVAEMYGADKGLGYFITNAGATYDTTDVLMGVIVLSTAAVLMTKVLRMAERRVSNWKA
jgi:ABC-type nitrate/sulfonate/bicarbonate transport system permease component